MKNEKEKLQEFLKYDENILFGYLFGSYADGTFREDSDIDIALYFDEYNFDVYAKSVQSLEKLLHKRVDLLVLNRAKNLYLLEKIIRDSVLIKDNEKRDDFELKRWHEIIDFKELNKRLEVA